MLVPIGQMMISGTMLYAHRLILALPGFIEADAASAIPGRFGWWWRPASGYQLILLYRYMNWLFVG